MIQKSGLGGPQQGRMLGRTTIVTGGASGIGRATVIRLLEEGAQVVFGDLNIANGTALIDELSPRFGAQVRFFPCDVGEESDIVRLVEFTRGTFGRLDAFVNNAGCGGALTDLVDTSVDDWDRTQQIVVRSVFLGTKHAARAMIEQGSGGSIVNIASVVGLTGGSGGTAYSTAKAAVINLSRSAATQLGKHRIRVNAVSPGTILTPLLTRGADEERFRSAAVYGQPWPEPGEAHHVAPVISFLCTDDATFITGENVVVDGGISAAGANIYSGEHPLGNAIVDSLRATQVTAFDNWSATSSSRFSSPSLRAERFMTPAVKETRRTVVLTGASKGLGLALTEKLVQLGHTVLGCARSPELVESLNRRFGAPHRFDVVDVSDEASIRDWSATLEANGYAPDLLLCNAAVSHAAKQIWKFETSEIEHVIRVNLFGTIHLNRYFIPGMLRRKKGIVVNFSSGWGRSASGKVGPYCASKWGVEGLTKAVSCELPPFMGMVSLHPGIIHTDTMGASFGEAAALYPTPAEWSEVAAPFILGITPKDNGGALTIPGMAAFRGIGKHEVNMELGSKTPGSASRQ